MAADLRDPDVDLPEDSSSDEDFNPEAADQLEESASSESEDEAPSAKPRGKKRKSTADAGHEELEWDSGDEKVIKERKKRRRKAKRKDGEDLDVSDEGDEAGFIKTRSQRKTEAIERKALATTKGSIVDVNALWSSITSAPIRPTSVLQPLPPTDASIPTDATTAPPAPTADSDHITITRTYQFAGKTHHESRRVPKDSAEAKLYLSSIEPDISKGPDDGDKENVDGDPAEEQKDQTPPLLRPLRRPSRFDPNPTGIVRSLPAELQLTWPRKRAQAAGMPLATEFLKGRAARPLPAATKLNTVDKSRYDWVEFVDREGIADQLELHGRAKESYLGRKGFLDQVNARMEEAGRAG